MILLSNKMVNRAILGCLLLMVHSLQNQSFQIGSIGESIQGDELVKIVDPKSGSDLIQTDPIDLLNEVPTTEKHFTEKIEPRILQEVRSGSFYERSNSLFFDLNFEYDIPIDTRSIAVSSLESVKNRATSTRAGIYQSSVQNNRILFTDFPSFIGSVNFQFDSTCPLPLVGIQELSKERVKTASNGTGKSTLIFDSIDLGSNRFPQTSTPFTLANTSQNDVDKYGFRNRAFDLKKYQNNTKLVVELYCPFLPKNANWNVNFTYGFPEEKNGNGLFSGFQENLHNHSHNVPYQMITAVVVGCSALVLAALGILIGYFCCCRKRGGQETLVGRPGVIESESVPDFPQSQMKEQRIITVNDSERFNTQTDRGTIPYQGGSGFDDKARLDTVYGRRENRVEYDRNSNLDGRSKLNTAFGQNPESRVINEGSSNFDARNRIDGLGQNLGSRVEYETRTANIDARITDLNQADERALDALPGIGPVLARRIVEHRHRQGPFRRIDELLAVPGIGPRLLERLRPHLREPAAAR